MSAIVTNRQSLLFRNLKSALEEFSEKPPIILKVNWAALLFLFFFLAYGYFGAITPEYEQFKSNLFSSIVMLAFLTLCFIALGLLAWKMADRFDDSIVFHRKDIFVLLSYFSILFLVSFEPLQFSLFSDELSYAGTAHAQGIYISLLISNHLHVLDGVPFQYLVQAVSLILLLLILSLFITTRKIPWQYKIIVFSLLLVVGRLVFSFTNGNTSPHPPLELVPPFLFGSLFGINDISFKLSYFTAYIFFIYILYRMIQRLLPFSSAYLLALAIGTIPVVWHLGTVVEHSFWGAVFFTVVVIDIVTSKKINYVRMFSFISIGVLMRQPVFLAFIPVLLIYFFEEITRKDTSDGLARLLLPMSGLLLFAPFLGRSLIAGTPSTPALNEGSMLESVFNAFNSDVILISILNSVTYWWSLLILLAFIPLSRNMLIRNFVLTLFFVAMLCIYYSIASPMWGFGKYQAEYAVPFAAAGMLLFVVRLFSLNYSCSKYIPAVLATCLIVANTVYYLQLPSANKPVDVLIGSVSTDAKNLDSGYHVLTALPYNYKDAYLAIKDAGMMENTYSIGPTYGFLPEIMNGYPTRSIRVARDMYINQRANMLSAPTSGWDVDLIEVDSRIKVVILGALPRYEKDKLIEKFTAHGWRPAGEYKNSKYGSTIVAMQR